MKRSPRKKWAVLVQVGRETANSAGRRARGYSGCDLDVDDYMIVMTFASSADRVVRQIVKALRNLGLKPVGEPVNLSREYPGEGLGGG